ncbi:hypothetical protein ABFS82_09G125300 [Erythranthe guttata]|uniref:Exocyst subunit Exo70 family protein n=1 Tax=Erythranthe guttata TaxID=4155 RepID=A0A022PY80_ERYGU|nr:PREDICTED: exocyst complex component EXO70B1-like [Erythranthe guttata]EYU21302.1 hypothetical protein MIMGU_mgv1a027150mg [Erythranthe guttata]|eukprot:XP_012856078.1 PREDICTED: exocyst complex component EXO70B1-like [Erythranthe guttata]
MDSVTLSASTPPNIPSSTDRLEDEFRRILLSVNFPVEAEIILDSQYTDLNVKFEQIEAVGVLRRTADRMTAAGYSQERVVDVYASARKSLLVEICKDLDLNVESEELKGRWKRAAKTAVHVSFPCERRLLDRIFPDLTADIAEACFVEIVEDSAVRLLRFTEAITNTGCPSRIFHALDLYELLSDLLPQIRTIFGSKSGESISNEAEKSLSGLSDCVMATFSEHEKALDVDKSRTATAGGSIHPLTRYTMCYMTYLALYKPTLSKLIEEASSKLELRVSQMIVDLKSNMECKSKSYKDASLRNLYMMNNLNYIVRKIIKSRELKTMIGNDGLVNELTEEYYRDLKLYLESTWESLLDSLRSTEEVKSGFFSSFVSKKLVYRQRLKVFYEKFKKVRGTQSSWIVSDEQLRKEVRSYILSLVIPVYTSFLEKHGSDIERGDHPGICISHSVEKLRKEVEEMFRVESIVC